MIGMLASAGATIYVPDGGGAYSSSYDLNMAGITIEAAVGADNPIGNFSGLISGTYGLTIGDGSLPVTVQLTNSSNTYGGGALIKSGSTLIGTPGGAIPDSHQISLSGGTIQFSISNGSPTIHNTFVLSGGGTIEGIGGGNAYLQQPVSGSGPLTIGGIVQLAAAPGTNTYTGGTIVPSGATLYGTVSTVPSSDTGGITLSGGTVDFISSGTYDGPVSLVEGTTSTIICSYLYLNHLTGAGGLIVPSGSEIIIVDEASYTGPTTIDGLLWVATSTFSSPSVTCNNDLTFQGDGSFGGGVSGTGIITNTSGVRQLSGEISGGISTQIGGGILWLQNSNNTYSGGNLMQGSSTLKGTSSSISGDVTFQTDTTGNTLIFTDSDADGTFGNSISGDGTGTISFQGTKTLTINQPIPNGAQVESTGRGTLVLGGTQAYTGSTTISGGSTLGFKQVLLHK